MLSGCGIYTDKGVKYGAATTIGISAGLPEGVSLVIGYKRYELISAEVGSVVDIGLKGKATMTGLEGEQHIKIGVVE